MQRRNGWLVGFASAVALVTVAVTSGGSSVTDATVDRVDRNVLALCATTGTVCDGATTTTTTTLASTTTQPPTTTTAPTTTTPATTTTTAGTGTFGAGTVGPSLEACTTTGTIVTSTAAVTSSPSGATILLRGGTYSTGFTAPANATVKPYNCESVQINDNITVNNGSTVAGFSVTANSDGWALQITSRTGVTIRNSNIRGGTVEAIRVDGTSNGVAFSGLLIDGGQANHAMKVKGTTTVHPTNISITNTRFTKLHFATASEDLLQLEQHGVVTVDHATFSNNTGEDGVDIKAGGGVTITGSLFEGGTLDEQCLLVNGAAPQTILIEGSRFNDCTVMVGANNSGNPTATIQGNQLYTNSTVHLRRSSGVSVTGNDWNGGGTLRLGTTTSGDQPKDVTITGNDLTGVSFTTVAGSTWTCDGSNTGSSGCD